MRKKSGTNEVFPRVNFAMIKCSLWLRRVLSYRLKTVGSNEVDLHQLTHLMGGGAGDTPHTLTAVCDYYFSWKCVCVHVLVWNESAIGKAQQENIYCRPSDQTVSVNRLD